MDDTKERKEAAAANQNDHEKYLYSEPSSVRLTPTSWWAKIPKTVTAAPMVKTENRKQIKIKIENK